MKLCVRGWASKVHVDFIASEKDFVIFLVRNKLHRSPQHKRKYMRTTHLGYRAFRNVSTVGRALNDVSINKNLPLGKKTDY